MTTVNYYSANHPTTLDDKTYALYRTGRMHVMSDTYTFVADKGASETVEIDFPRLLSGKVMVFPNLSHIDAKDGDANADLHVGFRAYRKTDGSTGSASMNYWMDNVDIGGGDKIGLWPAITGVTTKVTPEVFDAQDGLQVFVTIDTANMNTGDTITLTVVYAHIQ